MGANYCECEKPEKSHVYGIGIVTCRICHGAIKPENEPTVKSLEAENKELKELFDLQHKRSLEADQLWQESTGETCMPDLGKLLDWFMKKQKQLQAENKELKEKIAVAENDGETLKRLIIFALFMQDGSGILEKSPDYVIQKYSLATVGNKPEAYLSDSNKMKLQEYFLQWGI